MSREIWLGMQANEDEAHADCGCTLYRCDAESEDPFYVQCALHAQAEAMRKFVRRVAYDPIGYPVATHQEILNTLTAEARAILRAIEGRQTPC